MPPDDRRELEHSLTGSKRRERSRRLSLHALLGVRLSLIAPDVRGVPRTRRGAWVLFTLRELPGV
jgi:hypothetical protein